MLIRNKYRLKFQGRKIMLFLLFLGCFGVNTLTSFSQKTDVRSLEVEHTKCAFDSVLAKGERGLDFCRNIEDKIDLLLLLGLTHQMRQDFDLSLKYYDEARASLSDVKDPNYDLKVTMYLAEYFRAISSFDDADKYLESASILLQKHDAKMTPYSRALYLSRLAAVRSQQSNTLEQEDVVLKYSDSVVKLATKNGLDHLLGMSYQEIGFVYEKRMDDRSFEYYQKAFETFYAQGNLLYASAALSAKSRYGMKRKKYDLVLESASLGAKLAKENEFWPQARDNSNYLSEALQQLGHFEEALYAANDRNHYSQGIYDSQWQAEAARMERKFDLENALKEKDRESQKAEDQRLQNWYLLVAVVLITFLLVIIALLYLSVRSRNRKLSRTVDEKQVLLQEVYHRVKNNLLPTNDGRYPRGEKHVGRWKIERSSKPTAGNCGNRRT